MRRIRKTIEEFRLTGAELSEALGLSASRVSQLTSAGVLPRGADGHYDVSECVIGYERFLWRGAESRFG
jgi:hypothetical protein